MTNGFKFLYHLIAVIYQGPKIPMGEIWTEN